MSNNTQDNQTATEGELVTEAPKPVKPLREATRKEKAFAKYLVDNPSASITEAYKAVYNWNGGKEGAYQEASKALKKPTVKLELAKYSNEAESVLVEVLDYSNKYGKQGGHVGVGYAGIARQTADSILDRVHGKATTKIEQSTTSVNINIDLASLTEVEAEEK